MLLHYLKVCNMKNTYKYALIFLLLLSLDTFAQWDTGGKNPFYAQKSRNKTEIGGFIGAANFQDFTKWDADDHNSTSLGHLRLYMINRFDRNNLLVSSLQNRYFYSTTIFNSAFVNDLKTQNDLLNLSWVVLDKEEHVLHSEIDLLFYQFKNDNIRLRIGKQRYDWSQSWLWSANNYHNTYSILGYDIDNRSAVESASLKINFGRRNPWSVEFSSAPRKKLDNSNHIFRLHYADEGNEFQLVGGNVLKDYSLGIGGAIQINKNTSLYGEATYYHPRENSSTKAFIADFTYRQIINRQIVFMLETAYHSNPQPLYANFDVFTEANVKHILRDELQVSALWQYHYNKNIVYGLSSQYYFTDNLMDIRGFLQIDLSKTIEFYASANLYNLAFDDLDNPTRKQVISQLIYKF